MTGIFVTDLAAVLRGAGLDVVEADGWQERGFDATNSPGGGLVALDGGLLHITATSDSIKGNFPTWNTLVHGRSDLPGPLSQTVVGRNGAWGVLAAGRCNHAGAVDDERYSNPRSLAVEIEHSGTGPMSFVQYVSALVGAMAMSRRYGISWRGHKEAAVPAGRKIDPPFDMNEARAVLGLLEGAMAVAFNSRDRAKLDLLAWSLDKQILPVLSRLDAHRRDSGAREAALPAAVVGELRNALRGL